MDKFVCFQQWVQITPRVFYQVGLGDAALRVMGTEGWGQMSQVGTNDGHRCPRWVQRDGHRGMCTDVPDGHLTKGWAQISQMDTKGGRVEATEPLAPLPSPRLFNLDLFFKHQHLILRCGPRPPLIPNPPVVCGNIYSAFTSSSSPDFTGTSQFPITHIQ